MKKTILIIFLLFLVVPSTAYAEYVLPYPSVLPGNRLYAIKSFFEKLQSYWYFGDIGQTKYELKTADKYLVEAKTLFEYKQYKLAVSALQQSNDHFAKTVLSVRDVQGENKDSGEQKEVVKDAAHKHLEIIESLSKTLPETIIWSDEKKEPIDLSLSQLFKQAEIVRKYANQ